MASTRLAPAPTSPRRAASALICSVVDNMRRNLEPLRYSTLAPSHYTVYLHPREHARLEGIIPILQEQTLRALAEELDRMNRPSTARRFFSRLTGGGGPEVQSAGDWRVEFLPDPDGDMAEGDLLVDSELQLPGRPDLGVGERTRRITTVHAGLRTTAREQTVTRTSATTPAAVAARIAYRDDSGEHSYDVVKDSVTVGRGGVAFPVDVRIAASPDVSREHLRIRRDPASGAFFLIDLSTLGTTLNGRHVPRGFDDREGAKRENGAETALPDGARIGLADTVFLEFRKVG